VYCDINTTKARAPWSGVDIDMCGGDRGESTVDGAICSRGGVYAAFAGGRGGLGSPSCLGCIRRVRHGSFLIGWLRVSPPWAVEHAFSFCRWCVRGQSVCILRQ
jgi:hypothetical protein